MPQEFKVDTLKKALLSPISRPGVTTWSRLEGRPRKKDFDRSLRAEIRDPLWMLCRQWQFGEFKGEDAGSAVKAKVQLDNARLDRFAIRKPEATFSAAEPWQESVPISDEIPLETMVEQEGLLEDDIVFPIQDLALRIQIGKYWQKLLQQQNLTVAKSLCAAAYSYQPLLDRFADNVDPNHNHILQTDRTSWQTLQAVNNRIPDGIRLLKAIKDGSFAQFINDQNELTADNKTVLIHLGSHLIRWFAETYAQPKSAQEDAWEPAYLEYQFAVSAADDVAGNKKTTIVAEQYHHGRLDWYAFDISRRQSLRDNPEINYGPIRFTEEAPISFLPSQIEFNGMPNVRWWEFEDRRTDFGNINAGTTNIPLLMLAEFGLMYGNDWSVLPYDLPVGSLAKINGIVVTDVFGVKTYVQPANQGVDEKWDQWRMYNLDTIEVGDQVDHRMFLPPVVAKVQESHPIEKVVLVRDEMANMVWGIEDIIPGIQGKGIDGFEAALAVSRYFIDRQEEEPDPVETEAKIKYLLGNTVPENWIPFIVRHVQASNRKVRLQRASMPRLTDGEIATRVEPRGKVLRHGLDEIDQQPYFIHNIDVPRGGTIVKRAYQRTRWFNGKTFVWLGRQKTSGKGAGSSGLAFDQVLPKNE